MTPRNPIMAAVLAAALGLNCPGLSYAGETPQPQQPTAPSCPPNPQERNSLNALAAILHCEGPDGPAKKDVGNRLIAFVLMKDAQGPLFVTNALLATIPEDKRTPAAIAAAVSAQAAGDPATFAYYEAIRKWTRDATPSEVSELYVVMGDAAPPAWVTSHNVLKNSIKPISGPEDSRAGFIPGLTRRWRDGNQGKIGLQGGRQVDDTRAFLFAAAADARGILNNRRTRDELRLSVETNERAPVVTAGPRRVTVMPGLSTGGQYGYEDQYRDGGVGGNLTGRGQLPDGSRGDVSVPYYMKLETLADGSTQIGIYDHSEDPAYIRRVPITARGDQAVVHGAGRWPLTLNIANGENGDLRITLRRAGETGDANAIATSASELARARYDQAIRKSTLADGSVSVVRIGDQDFVVSRQGSGTNELALFFPANLETEDWRSLRPSARAVIGVPGVDGEFSTATGRPDLMGARPPQHLELENGRWVVKPGAGDPPPGSTPAPTPTGTQPGAQPGTTTDRVSQVANQAEGWVDDPQANAGLDEPTKTAGYRIQSRQGQNGQKEYNIIAPPGFLTNTRSYAGVVNMRGLGHYVVYEIAGEQGGAAYQDLLVKATQADANGTAREDFATVAQFYRQGRRAASVTAQAGEATRWLGDEVVLVDVLKTYLGFTNEQAATAERNTKTYRGSAKFVIYGASAGSVVVAKEPDIRATSSVFPTIQAAPNTGNPATQPGQTGSVLDLLAGDSNDEPFRNEVGLASSGNAVLRKSGPQQNATAALYERTTAPAPGNPNEPRWYLMIKYREARTPPGVAKTGLLAVFQGHEAPALDAIGLEGNTTHPSTGISIQTGAKISMIQGSNQARGGWVLLKDGTAPTEQNCLGAVLWWGMTKEVATTTGCNNRPLP